MNPVVSTVSAGVGIICLVAGILIWVFGRHAWPRAVVALILTGSVGLVGSPVGEWVASAVAWVDSIIANVVGRFTGTAAVSLFALGVLVFLAFRFYQRRIDDHVLAAAAIAPFAAASIPGVIGNAATTIITVPANVIGWAVAWLWGLV